MRTRTKAMSHLVKTLAAAVVGTIVAVSAVEPKAQAQEIQLTGPLAGAKAVKKLRLYREGRFEVAPSVSFTLLDEYRRAIITGLRLQYNITDWLGVGLWGGYGLGYNTDLTDQIDQTALRNARTAINLNHTGAGTATSPFKAAPFGDQVGRIQWVANPQITLVPFRGKLALFQALFVDTDAYLHAGLGIVGLQERPDCGGTGNSCTDPKSFALGSRVAFAPTFGLGLNFWLADLVSVGIEYKAMPFSWNRGGFDSRGGAPNGNFPDNKITSDDQTFKFNQMLSISVGFALGSRKTSE
jgi:outer membrane beta-barrel protein